MIPVIVDLHLHSRYSLATSSAMEPPELARWANIKGIDLLGTGDITHPEWLKTLKQQLRPLDDTGIYEHGGVRFVLSGEVSVVWKQDGRGRRIHLLFLAPTFGCAEKIQHALASMGRLASNGRPMLTRSAETVVDAIWTACPDAVVIPAHVWTPWYSVFGARSGFDSMAACFGRHTERIGALETGLSSDPAMNRRWAALDRYRLVSFSDAHSPANLGREATVLELPDMSFSALAGALGDGPGYVGTIEFYPQQGKYHYDGHRACGVRFAPEETKKAGGICPVCGKPLTVGVLHRVDALADRPSDAWRACHDGDVRYVVPLMDLLSKLLGVSAKSKRVAAAYSGLIDRYGSEFALLLDCPVEEIEDGGSGALADAIRRARAMALHVEPGYDGVYGTVDLAARGTG